MSDSGSDARVAHIQLCAHRPSACQGYRPASGAHPRHRDGGWHAVEDGVEDKPADVNPARDEEEDLDSEDDGDGLLQPFEAPEGSQVAAAPPTSSQLEYGNLAERRSLNGRTILFHWAVVGWCVGKLTANLDGRRKKVDGATPNFWAYYEVDQEERIHSLTLATYGQGGAGSWVLLEPVSE